MKMKKLFFLSVLILSVSLILFGCDAGTGSGIDETRLIQDANNTLDEFFTAMENRSMSAIEETLSSDLTYTNGMTMDKEEFLQIYSNIFLEGGYFIDMTLINRINDLASNTKIIIGGSLRAEGYDIYGQYFNVAAPAQFTLVRENNQWKITKWIDS